jgi:hypothetical protein
VAGQILAIAVGIALLYAPGIFLLAAFGARFRSRWTVGPAITLAAFSGLALVHAEIGISWSPLSALLGILVLAVVVRLAGHLLGLPGPRGADRAVRRTDIAVVCGALLVCVVLVPYTVQGMGGLDTVNNSYDAFFHTSAIGLMRESGDVSALTGTAPLHSGAEIYYPTAFHTVATLVPATPVPAGNAVLVALFPLMFTSAAGLADAVLPGHERTWKRGAMVVGAASTVLVLRSTATMGLVMGLWPATLGSAVFLSLAAVALHIGRRWSRAPWRRRGAMIAVLAAALLGAGSAHTSTLVDAGVLLAAVLLMLTISRLRHRRGVRSWLPPLMLLVVGSGLYLVVAAVLLAEMSITPVPETDIVNVLAAVLADRPRVIAIPLAAWAMVPWLLLALAGGISALRHCRVILLMGAVVGAVTLLLTMGTLSPDGLLHTLLNPWYGARERLAPLWATALVVLVAAGLFAIDRLLARRRPRLPGVVPAVTVSVLALVIALSPTHLGVMASLTYTSGPEQYRDRVSAGEQDFIEDSAAQIPAGSVILGDPNDGTIAYWTAGDREVVFPTLARPGLEIERRAATEAHKLGVDPLVCEAMTALDVTHVYVDRSGVEEGTEPELGDTADAADRGYSWDSIADIGPENLTVVAEENGWMLAEVDLPC